jgi:hypothetical protein
MQCTPKELAILLEAYTTIAKTFDPYNGLEGVDFKSPLLRSIVFALPGIADAVGGLVAAINLQKAKSQEKSELWVDDDKYPTIQSTKLVSQGRLMFWKNVTEARSCASKHQGILSVESELEEELKSSKMQFLC